MTSIEYKAYGERHNAGYDARENHQDSNSNPYPYDSQHWSEWLEGWMLADTVINLPPLSE